MKVKTADMNAYQKQYREEHKHLIREKEHEKRIIVNEYLDNYKKDRECEKCGYKEHPEILEFHHLGNKFKDVSEMRKYKVERVEEEVAKCILICPNCHRLHHWKELKEKKKS